MFPRLFSISSQKEARICDVRIMGDGVGRWDFLWRRRLFVWEENLIEELLDFLPDLVLTGLEDEWRWGPGEGGLFSVHSVYTTLGTALAPPEQFSVQQLRVFERIWKCPAPSKVIAFSWKLLRNRIPTKSNLVRRGVHVGGVRLIVSTVLGVRKMPDTYFYFAILLPRCGMRYSGGLV
jgi:hypothetical protein